MLADFIIRVVAQVVLSNGAKGEYQSISWGWGYAILRKGGVSN